MNRTAVLETYRVALDGELKECFAGRNGFLYNLLRYHFGWVDQQGQPESAPERECFHSLLALAACEAWSGECTPALPVAAAVELVYNFSLVHGDVQAGRVDANARPSIWWVWGPAQAINAGDGLHALGRVAILRLSQVDIPAEGVLAAVEMLDRSCLALCEGQYLDLQFQDRLLVTIADYDQMIDRKAGALAGCSAAAGALAGGSDDATQGQFRDLGVKLGLAWQINRDVADFWGPAGDGVTASNVLNKKKSLPLIYAMEHCSTAAKRELGSIYMKRVLEPGDVARIIGIMEETDARAYAESKARELAEQALALLDDQRIPAERQEGLRALARQALADSA
jgi:geranylgeranyl diphosphate synthase type I